MFEFITEVLLIGTGSFIRWIFVGRHLKFPVFFKEHQLYWIDMLLGLAIWIWLITLLPY